MKKLFIGIALLASMSLHATGVGTIVKTGLAALPKVGVTVLTKGKTALGQIKYLSNDVVNLAARRIGHLKFPAKGTAWVDEVILKQGELVVKTQFRRGRNSNFSIKSNRIRDWAIVTTKEGKLMIEGSKDKFKFLAEIVQNKAGNGLVIIVKKVEGIKDSRNLYSGVFKGRQNLSFDSVKILDSMSIYIHKGKFVTESITPASPTDIKRALQLLF